LRQRGLIFFWIYFRESVLFDLKNGTQTSSRVPKNEQQISSGAVEQDDGLLYVASFTSVTRDTVRIARDQLGADRFRKAQFFDLGCGKGKALFVYAQAYKGEHTHPAIGIEYDAGLADLANANLTKTGLGDAIQIVADSATNLKSYLTSGCAIIYLYNSFQGETLRTVLAVLQSIPHVLIYVDPAEKDVLDQFGYQIKKSRKGRYNADTWLVATYGLDGSEGHDAG
jgi:SAM-dependent methyltransferase